MRKVIPDHIKPKYDEDITKWGMYNHRLNAWVGKDPDFGHAFFDSAEEAKIWYKEQI